MIPSYAILQDEFYNHMVEAGFKDFERGERGSTAEHLSIVEYKVQQSKERLGAVEDKIVEKSETLGTIDSEIAMKEKSLDRVAEKYSEIEKIEVRAEQVSRIGQLTSDGSYLLTERQHMALTNMAREGLYARTKIGKLQEQITDLTEKLNLVMDRLTELHEKTQDFTIAMRFAPQRIKAVINDVLARNKIKADLIRHRPMPPLFGNVKKERPVRSRGMER
jgi:chromosome segregation ATPase